ncbi:unnamed protein product [Cyclocybe aegerita]|uniref:Uncharacterized protein n=1 Tax=Cyclocybe aegerita TaxID=1973307 RepID=A0A8S0WBI5_CYCAE|nr:unnamed protein product [Cyclocybe aegerita]
MVPELNSCFQGRNTSGNPLDEHLVLDIKSSITAYFKPVVASRGATDDDVVTRGGERLPTQDTLEEHPEGDQKTTISDNEHDNGNIVDIAPAVPRSSVANRKANVNASSSPHDIQQVGVFDDAPSESEKESRTPYFNFIKGVVSCSWNLQLPTLASGHKRASSQTTSMAKARKIKQSVLNFPKTVSLPRHSVSTPEYQRKANPSRGRHHTSTQTILDRYYTPTPTSTGNVRVKGEFYSRTPQICEPLMNPQITGTFRRASGMTNRVTTVTTWSCVAPCTHLRQISS